MKTELINRENNASLVISAESEFERKTLEMLNRFKDRSIIVNSEKEFGVTTKGSIVVTFFQTNQNG